MTFLKTNYTKEFCLADSWSPIPLSQLTDHKEKKTGNKAPYHKFLGFFLKKKKTAEGSGESHESPSCLNTHHT